MLILSMARWARSLSCVMLYDICMLSGYLPPEYEVGKKLSEKQDIYAFGVILFELVSGRPAFDRMNKTNHHLGEWVTTQTYCSPSAMHRSTWS